MFVRIFSGLSHPPVDIPATEVLICDDNGTPLSVAAVHGTAINVAKYGDPEFRTLLDRLGLGHLTPEVVPWSGSQPPSGSQRVS